MMGEWRDIESAPKDVHILVYGEALKWRGMDGRALAFKHSDYNGCKSGVITLDGRCGALWSRSEITHWMPLPPPPNIEGEG